MYDESVVVKRWVRESIKRGILCSVAETVIHASRRHVVVESGGVGESHK